MREWQLELSLRLSACQPGTPAHGCVPSVQSVFPPQLNLSGSTLVDAPQRWDSISRQAENGNVTTPFLVNSAMPL